MSSPGRSARSLPAVVRRLGVVSFFNDFASEMVYPLLPALVTTTLGGTAVSLGALDGVAEAASAVAKLGSGVVADRPRRRRLLVIGGYAIAALVRPVMGLAGAAWQVIALRGTDRLGKGVRTPARDAVIADATDPEMQGRAFGYHRSMDHAGAVIGPLVAWFLVARLAMGPDEVIAWSVVPGVLAVAAVTWALAGRRAISMSEPAATSAPVVSPTADARTVFGLIVAYAFARMPETLLLLRLQDVGVGLSLVPVLWALLHVVRSAASYPGGWLSDVVGSRRTMALGWLLYGGVCAGMAWGGSEAHVVLWFLAFGLVAGVTESPERSFVARAGSRGRRGSRFGVYHASVGFVALPGSLLLGWIYSRAGGPTALTVSGAVAAALGIVAWLGIRRPSAPEPAGA
jgi:MFS family permease